MGAFGQSKGNDLIHVQSLQRVDKFQSKCMQTCGRGHCVAPESGSLGRSRLDIDFAENEIGNGAIFILPSKLFYLVVSRNCLNAQHVMFRCQCPSGARPEHMRSTSGVAVKDAGYRIQNTEYRIQNTQCKNTACEAINECRMTRR